MTHDMVAIVAAAATSGGSSGGNKKLLGIGHQGSLPWNLPGDMQHFRRVTTAANTGTGTGGRNAVIMGRRTWESIPPKFRPLKGRINVVLTTGSSLSPTGKDDDGETVLVANSMRDAAEQLDQRSDDVGTVFVIGGERVYREALEGGYVSRVLFTEVSNLPDSAEFDAFFPALDPDQWKEGPYLEEDKENNNDRGAGEQDEEDPAASATTFEHVDSKSGLTYRFLQYDRRNVEELQYLDLCRSILSKGIRRGDRTGTGTLSTFGAQLRFDLRDGKLPLLTTKRTFWRGVAEELLWFIAGNTNANVLADKGVRIWDGNGSREFLDQRGLGHREEGDLGPVYGFQWRHFGAKYVDMHTDYAGQGVDQLAACIEKIKTDPEDRRIIMSAWNPADLDEMALPPCHMFCQFYVDTVNGELSCQMYQRSADMGLGVPFNIASYALLTHLVAHATGLKPGEFIHTIGDAHIYLNHVEALEEQLLREPRQFPVLKINPDKKDIDSFEYSDLEVIGYNPHKTIKMKMAV